LLLVGQAESGEKGWSGELRNKERERMNGPRSRERQQMGNLRRRVTRRKTTSYGRKTWKPADGGRVDVDLSMVPLREALLLSG
jgi:hypothetical protein